MKTRADYVSNSSSSSFIVYGREMDYCEMMMRMWNGRMRNHVLCVVEKGGISGEVEDFIFRVTRERLDYLNRHGVCIMEGRFIETRREWKNDACVVKVDKPLRGGRLIYMNMDDSSPATDKVDDPSFLEWVKYRSGK